MEARRPAAAADLAEPARRRRRRAADPPRPARVRLRPRRRHLRPAHRARARRLPAQLRPAERRRLRPGHDPRARCGSAARPAPGRASPPSASASGCAPRPTSVASLRVVVGQFGGLSAGHPVAQPRAAPRGRARDVARRARRRRPGARGQPVRRRRLRRVRGRRPTTGSVVHFYRVPDVRVRSAAARWPNCIDRRASAPIELPVAEPCGMRLPVLRETRMPAVLCQLAPVRQAADVAAMIAAAVRPRARDVDAASRAHRVVEGLSTGLSTGCAVSLTRVFRVRAHAVRNCVDAQRSSASAPWPLIRWYSRSRSSRSAKSMTTLPRLARHRRR